MSYQNISYNLVQAAIDAVKAALGTISSLASRLHESTE